MGRRIANLIGAVLSLTMVLVSCTFVKQPEPGDSFTVGGGVTGPGSGAFGPKYGITSWFNGLWLDNTVSPVVIRSAGIRRLEGRVRVVDVLLAKGSEFPKGAGGSFTGTCGTEPPAVFRWHAPTGLRVLPGERVLPLIGLVGGPGSVHDLRITYSLVGEDDVLVQDFFYVAEIRNEEEICPPNGDKLPFRS